MSADQHQRFLTWLVAGAAGDPARDLAVHASLCAECMRWIAAHDALASIDPGRAPLPASNPVLARRATTGHRLRRLAAAGAAVVVLGGVGALGAAQIARMTTEPPSQGVLAATSGPHGSPSPSR